MTLAEKRYGQNLMIYFYFFPGSTHNGHMAEICLSRDGVCAGDFIRLLCSLSCTIRLGGETSKRVCEHCLEWLDRRRNDKDPHWPSLSARASASGCGSIANTNVIITVTRQQEMGCPRRGRRESETKPHTSLRRGSGPSLHSGLRKRLSEEGRARAARRKRKKVGNDI